MTLLLHLRIVGALLLALAGLNLLIPRHLGWDRDLEKVSLLNRQIYRVHSAFILLTIAMFGVLALFFADELVAPSRLARATLAGLSLFWLIRLLVQWLYYDSHLWRGHRFNTCMHFLFSGLFAYFAITFLLALFTNLREG